MVWIPGGAFITGTGYDIFYGPDYLLRKGVILVTLNYRVNVFGFLNLEDEVAPGNQGLKDQVLALLWVQNNIVNFGGDPNNVTIFGESAGGASVHYLTLSPLARGLFQKAISQSGVALNPWASVLEKPKQYAIQLCEVLGKKLHDSKEILNFLKTIKPSKLMDAFKKLKTLKSEIQNSYFFGPGVDDKSSNPFLPVPLEEAAKNGVSVPYLLGYNSREGIFFSKGIKEKEMKLLNDNFEEYLHPNTLAMLRSNNLTANDLRYYYFKDKISVENFQTILDFSGDINVVESVHRVAKLQIKSNTPTYVYQLTYSRRFSFIKTYTEIYADGAAHVDELRYLFKMNIQDIFTKKFMFMNLFNKNLLSIIKLAVKFIKILPTVLSPAKGTEDYRMMEKMTEMWTNFAKTAQPTPTTSDLIPIYWPPIMKDKFTTLIIDRSLRIEEIISWHERLS